MNIQKSILQKRIEDRWWLPLVAAISGVIIALAVGGVFLKQFAEAVPACTTVPATSGVIILAIVTLTDVALSLWEAIAPNEFEGVWRKCIRLGGRQASLISGFVIGFLCLATIFLDNEVFRGTMWILGPAATFGFACSSIGIAIDESIRMTRKGER